MVISHLRTKRLSPFSHSNTHFGDPIPSPTVIHRPTVPENRECSRARSDTSELLEPHGGYGMIWPLSGARPYSTTQRHGGAVPVAGIDICRFPKNGGIPGNPSSHPCIAGMLYMIHPICELWCWNMRTNICPNKTTQFCSKYTIHTWSIWA